MKLSTSDLQSIRGAIAAARLAGVQAVVITNGYVSGVHPKRIAAIYSPVELTLDKEITIGINSVVELEKRLTLFGDDILVEAELSDKRAIRKLNIRGKQGKIEFRCTDERLIVYPKEHNDDPTIELTLTPPEVALLSKGVKTIGADSLTLQVKRSGEVHLECRAASNDAFELDLSAVAEFIGDPHPYVNQFDVSSTGVFLPLLEHMIKNRDEVSIVISGSGNITLKALGHDVFAAPTIHAGD